MPLILVFNGPARTVAGQTGCDLAAAVCPFESSSINGVLSFTRRNIPIPSFYMTQDPQWLSQATPFVAYTREAGQLMVSSYCAKGSCVYRVTPGFYVGTIELMDYYISCESGGSISSYNGLANVAHVRFPSDPSRNRMGVAKNIPLRAKINWQNISPKTGSGYINSSTVPHILTASEADIRDSPIYVWYGQERSGLPNDQRLLSLACLDRHLYEQAQENEATFWRSYSIASITSGRWAPAAVVFGRIMHMVYCAPDGGIYYFCIPLNARGWPLQNDPDGTTLPAQGGYAISLPKNKAKYAPMPVVLDGGLYVFYHQQTANTIAYVWTKLTQAGVPVSWSQPQETTIALNGDDKFGGLSLALVPDSDEIFSD